MIDSPRSRLCQRGILGGTFDPVHYGHLAIAQAALTTHSLAEVIWLPQIFPTHKSAMTPVRHRWAMVELAIEPYPQFRLPTSLASWCNCLSGVSTSSPLPPTDYAIHQWQILNILYPHSNWFWILGADSFLTLPRWKGREILIPACRWLVATRNQLEPQIDPKKFSESPLKSPSESLELQKIQQVIKDIQLQGIDITWQILPMPSIDISSTSIRQSLQSRLPSPEKSLPASVRQYIESHSLYQH